MGVGTAVQGCGGAVQGVDKVGGAVQGCGGAVRGWRCCIGRG